MGVKHGGNDQCSDSTKVNMDSPSSSIFYGKLIFPSDETMKLDLVEYTTDGVETDVDSFMCEKDLDWSCPEGYLLFQESCYKFLEDEATSMEGHLKCQFDENAKLVEVNSLMHMKFLNTYAKSESKSNFWVNLHRHVNSLDSATDSIFFNQKGDFFPVLGSQSTGAQATDDCVEQVIDKFDTLQTVSCFKNASVLCEVPQNTAEDMAFAIPQPLVLMPLDLMSGINDLIGTVSEVVEMKIAFTMNPSTKNSLNSASHFMGVEDSYIDVTLAYNYFKNGLTVSAWIYVEEIQDNEKQFLIDTRGPYQDPSDVFNRFQLYIEKASGDVSLGSVLCDGPETSDGPEAMGTCTDFKSSSSTPIPQNEWTYIAFTYDAYNQLGTFVIDQIHGYEDSGPQENKFFNFDSIQWLGINTQGFAPSFRIGGSRDESTVESYSGKLSCIQIYNQFLKPSQIHHISSCNMWTEHTRHSKCPPGRAEQVDSF